MPTIRSPDVSRCSTRTGRNTSAATPTLVTPSRDDVFQNDCRETAQRTVETSRIERQLYHSVEQPDARDRLASQHASRSSSRAVGRLELTDASGPRWMR